MAGCALTTTLQVGRSRDRFPLSPDIFPVASDSSTCPGVDWASKNEYQDHPGGKSGRCVRLTTYHLHVPIVKKSGGLNLLEPCGPVQACNGTALPFIYISLPVHSAGEMSNRAREICIFVCNSGWNTCCVTFVLSYVSSFHFYPFFTPFLGAVANCEKRLLASSCVSVHMEQLGSHWTDFHEIWYMNIFRKSVEKIQVSLEADKHNG